MAILAPHDIRFALRTLRTRPGFTAAVVATLALGIGASTAMFSLVDAALLRPLPFAEPGRLVILWGVAGPERNLRGASLPEVADWRAMNHSLTDVSAADQISLNLRTGEEAERVNGEMVSAGYFSLLGARAERGRTFLPEEDRTPDAHPVVVVSHRLWQERYAGDPALVGRMITLNDRPFTVVGVMPPDFRGLSFITDVWIPTAMISTTASASLFTDRGTRWLIALGRLKPGVTMADAQRDLDAVGRRLAEAHPDYNKDRGVLAMSLRQNYLGPVESLLRTLFGAVLLFLLIACANVTSLQLVRATARRREVALRLALGASRPHLVRQLLTEGLVLGLLGGAAGVLAAYWLIQGLLPLVPAGLLPTYVTLRIDARALAFSTLLAVLTGVVCGLAPALAGGARAHGAGLTDALKEGARSAASGLGRIRRMGAQQALVVAEVALALVLLVGAGLMMRSLARQLAVAPGFRADGVLAARVSLPRARYTPQASVAFAEQLVERLGALPSVRAASVSSDLPLTNNSSASLMVTDRNEPEPIRYYRHSVTPGFFETLGIALLSGRAFTPQDRDSTPRVAIVSEAMAKRVWPREGAVGHRFHLGSSPSAPEVTVVGVVRTARFRNLTADLTAPGSEPDVFFPLAQRPDRDLEIAVRSRTGTLPSAAELRREIAALDPGLALFATQPLADAVRAQTGTARFGSLVLSVFSAVALLLAAVGIYGLIAFVVGLSRREIAIRMALGAAPGGVLRLVVRNGMLLALGGAVLGLAGAALGSRLLASQLFGVSARDPLTFGGVTLAVLAVALAASYLPARRAARTDPQLALKAE